MTSASEWQSVVGKSWAEMAHLTDRAFGGLMPKLLSRIAATPGHSIFDIGCGAGVLAIAVARARPDASVLGCDISPDLVDVARVRSDNVPNLRIIEGDASRLLPPMAPDLLISRHGVMFFDNPVTAFAHLAQISRSGARLIFSSFRCQEDNLWASEIATVMANPYPSPPPPYYVPGPFAFRDPAFVRQVLASGGWTDINFEPVAFRYIAGRGNDPVSDAMAFFSRIGPMAAQLRTLDSDVREDLRHRLRGVIKRWHNGDEVTFPAAAWIVTATRL